MLNRNFEKQKGAIAVEATIILPIAVLSVLLLLYLSLIMFQRANLQSVLETAVVYYKTAVTDNFVEINSTVIYKTDEQTKQGQGNSYTAASANAPINPYVGRHQSATELENGFKNYFFSIASGLLFNKEDIKVSLDYSNYLITKQFEATAEQTIVMPLDFSIIGIDEEYTIKVTAKAAAVDNDAVIRNIDYTIYLLEDTEAGEFLKDIGTKAAETYNKFKEMLGVE